MRISSIAFANVRRRKAKASFLAFGIAIGIGTVVALLSLTGALKEEIGSQLDRFGANTVIVPKSNTLALDYGGISVSGVAFDEHQLKNSDVDRILQIPYRKRLSVVAPKLLTTADVEGRKVLLAGVNFSSEIKLKRWWRISGRPPQKSSELLVGYDVAKDSGLIAMHRQGKGGSAAGDHSPDMPEPLEITRRTLMLAGHEHQVAGIIEQTGGPAGQLVFGALEHVQQLVGKSEQLSLIEVSALCKDCPVSDIVNQIAAQLPNAKASAIQQAVKARTETVERLSRFSVVVSSVVLAIGALMIFTTVMGAVVERAKEIGVLRAIGFRRRHIIQELLLEVLFISVVGGLIGWISGVAAGWAALPYFSETGVALQLRAWTAAAAVVVATFMGVISTVIPRCERHSLTLPRQSVMYNHDAAPGFITVHQVSKDYSEGMTGPSVRVLSDVNLQIREGEFISLMGQSGSGKSTLLTILGGMNHPSCGNVLIDGIDVYGLSDERRADFRAEYLGFVFSAASPHAVPQRTGERDAPARDEANSIRRKA